MRVNAGEYRSAGERAEHGKSKTWEVEFIYFEKELRNKNKVIILLCKLELKKLDRETRRGRGPKHQFKENKEKNKNRNQIHTHRHTHTRENIKKQNITTQYKTSYKR